MLSSRQDPAIRPVTRPRLDADPEAGLGGRKEDIAFIRRLAREMDGWVADGRIAPGQRDAILSQYRALAEADEKAGPGRLVTVVSVLGAILVGAERAAKERLRAHDFDEFGGCVSAGHSLGFSACDYVVAALRHGIRGGDGFERAALGFPVEIVVR